MSNITSSEPGYYIPKYPDCNDDCKGVLEEWFEQKDEWTRKFPINKSKPIFFSQVMDIGVLGQLYPCNVSSQVPDGLTASVTLDSQAEDQLRELGEKTGIHGCCKLWLNKEYYILCSFVKIVNGIDRATRYPIYSKLRPTIDKLILKESFLKPMNPNPPEDPDLYLETKWFHEVETGNTAHSDEDPAETDEDESDPEQQVDSPEGSTVNLIKQKDKEV
ncbi:hypothetical protein DM02DRAFT_658878 [Periconia macrospinosa]|uniref:Uncharacterized protein n=1 Tax=Periconia macrospinosa TaxID=97972 RepID=A0A2V1DHT9_9PLEO|nr:hypothetical protein DM02DRAFT_658878 [Periconia macrospinosa]